MPKPQPEQLMKEEILNNKELFFSCIFSALQSIKTFSGYYFFYDFLHLSRDEFILWIKQNFTLEN
jgi:hypothetical protein